MTENRTPLILGIAVGLTAVALAFAAGTTATEQWQLAARWTARFGFPIFIITYSASSLVRLFPGDTTRGLLRDRRWWGLGFAACHTVHLYALSVYVTKFATPPPLTTLIGGGLGYALLYLMALTSNRAAMKALGRGWKWLHRIGIHWLWLIFTTSYLGRVSANNEMPYSAIALGIAVLALLLRIAAAIKSWRRRRATDTDAQVA